MVRKIWVAALLLCAVFSAGAQTANPNYNKVLADSLGADEYGMKMYMLVILKTGLNTSESKNVQDSLFAGHMKNIQRLASIKKLVVAGPLAKNDNNYRGIFILDVKTKKEAEELLQTDPTIKAGVLAADIYGWYGSAALPMYLPASEKVGKSNF